MCSFGNKGEVCMKLKDAVAKRLKELLEEKKITQYALSKISKVPQSTISTILNGNIKTVKLSTVFELCVGLNIEISEFFSKDYLKAKNIEQEEIVK
jgi:transcriptional regulator with XRE-family HTH domain